MEGIARQGGWKPEETSGSLPTESNGEWLIDVQSLPNGQGNGGNTKPVDNVPSPRLVCVELNPGPGKCHECKRELDKEPVALWCESALCEELRATYKDVYLHFFASPFLLARDVGDMCTLQRVGRRLNRSRNLNFTSSNLHKAHR